MLQVDSYIGHTIFTKLDILSRSRGTKFRRGFIFHFSIEVVIEKCLNKFVNK